MIRTTKNRNIENTSELDVEITIFSNNLGESHSLLVNMISFGKDVVNIKELTSFQSEIVSSDEQIELVKTKTDGILHF